MTEDKYYRMTSEEMAESDFWIVDAYRNSIIDKSIQVFVPSYNSYDNILLCKLMGKDMWPCTFVVRESQKEDYLKNQDIISVGHSVLGVEDSLISSAAAVREYILNYCINNNIKYFIMIDDDLIRAGFKVPYTTKSGANSATCFKYIEFPKFCSMFYNMSLKAFDLDNKIAITGMHVRGNLFPSPSNVIDEDRFIHICGNSPRSFICINVDRFKDNDIHFDSERGKNIHEDLDILCQLALKGYYWGTFDWMYYQDNGASLFSFDSLVERVSVQVNTMLEKYNNYDFFTLNKSSFGSDGELKNKFVNINVSGRKVRKYLKEKFYINPVDYISYFSLNDSDNCDTIINEEALW